MISRHALSAVASVPDGRLHPKSASITLDEGWSPYVQAEIRCSLPAPAVLPLLDPRATGRVTLRATREYGDSAPASLLSATWAGMTAAEVSAMFTAEPVTTLSEQHFKPWNPFGLRGAQSRPFDLVLRSRTIDPETGELVLGLASEEVLLQDDALIATAVLDTGHTTVRGLCEMLLHRIGRTLLPGSADGMLHEGAAVWSPGVSSWAFVAPLVQQAGLRLWCDERRRWRLDSAVTEPAGDAVRIAVGENMVSGSESINRDADWADAVVISYEWADPLDGSIRTAYDTAYHGRYTKVLHLEYRTPYPGPGAAEHVLNRLLSRGRTAPGTAVSDYDTSPGRPYEADIALTPALTGVVRAVTFRFPDHRMDVTPRETQLT